ncbi:MAG: NUDIX domain-containing protein [Halieaceae bacterium]
MDRQFGAEDVRILAQPRIFNGHFSIRRLQLQHRSFSGGWCQPLTREVFDRGDAVGVLLWDPQRDELVMLEQFRPGAIRGNESPWMLELVAGIVEAGEEDEQVARRETVEEADLQLLALEPIARFYPSAGACSEQVRLFLGKVDSAAAGGVHGCAEEGEDIRVQALPRTQVLELLAAGLISNGHTLVALQWLQLHGEALRQRWT